VSTTPAAGDPSRSNDAETSAAGTTLAERLGVKGGSVVLEIGYDDDSDADLRDSIADLIGDDFVDEDSDEVADVVLLWFREDDGDLVDTLVDAIGPLADTGLVWLMTPKRGQAGHVEPSDIAEAAPTAGLSQTSTLTVGNWSGSRLATPKANAGKAKPARK
jgi:hypothetical protein